MRILMKAARPVAAALLLTAALSAGPQPLMAQDAPLKVVATTTLFADLVRKIGGDRVEVKSIASPKFNIHFIQPKPSDVKNTARADLFVFAGLDLEAWADPLLEAAGNAELFRGGSKNLDLSAGIPLVEPPTGTLSRAQGDQHLFGNPHYQMNPENARVMARAIADKLKALDPAGAELYEAGFAAFDVRLTEKIAEWRALCAPSAGKEILAYHRDIVYFADFAGLKCEHFFEPKPGIPPAPKHLAFLEDYLKKNGIKVITLASYYPRGAADALAAKAGAKTAIICQSAGEVPGTDDFFSFFDYNFKTIAEALA